MKKSKRVCTINFIFYVPSKNYATFVSQGCETTYQEIFRLGANGSKHSQQQIAPHVLEKKVGKYYRVFSVCAFSRSHSVLLFHI